MGEPHLPALQFQIIVQALVLTVGQTLMAAALSQGPSHARAQQERQLSQLQGSRTAGSGSTSELHALAMTQKHRYLRRSQHSSSQTDGSSDSATRTSSGCQGRQQHAACGSDTFPSGWHQHKQSSALGAAGDGMAAEAPSGQRLMAAVGAAMPALRAMQSLHALCLQNRNFGAGNPPPHSAPVQPMTAALQAAKLPSPNRRLGGGAASEEDAPIVLDFESYYDKGRLALCRVKGCQVDLRNEKVYYSRFYMCEAHVKARRLLMPDGSWQRFCQQCACFHPLDQFRGNQKNCVGRLSRRNELRRERATRNAGRQHASAAAMDGNGSGASGSGGGGGGYNPRSRASTAPKRPPHARFIAPHEPPPASVLAQQQQQQQPHAAAPRPGGAAAPQSPPQELASHKRKFLAHAAEHFERSAPRTESSARWRPAGAAHHHTSLPAGTPATSEAAASSGSEGPGLGSGHRGRASPLAAAAALQQGWQGAVLSGLAGGREQRGWFGQVQMMGGAGGGSHDRLLALLQAQEEMGAAGSAPLRQ